VNEARLTRRLGLGDAVVIGAGSMIGAGVFAAWGPAAQAAGTGLLLGLAVAGLVAMCNAMSSAQLAAIHPESGGTYLYGRRQLGPGWGHLAGWGFVVGKTASCVAMALTAGSYLWPEQHRVVAAGFVIVVTLVNLGGLTRTVAVTRALLVVSLAALTLVVVAGWSGGAASIDRLTPVETDLPGILRSGAFLFFAFAGYARIATLGEEVKDPSVTIPRAIPTALLAVLGIYAVVGTTALATAGVTALAGADAPLALVADPESTSVARLVGVGAAVASFGVLLNLVPGVSRTALAMARNAELPRWFSVVDGSRSVPVRAELAVLVVVLAGVVTLDLTNSIAVSGLAVLTYYAVTNAAALTLAPAQRRWPPAVAVLGLVGCLALVAALPAAALVGGGAVLVSGVGARWVTTRRAALGR